MACFVTGVSTATGAITGERQRPGVEIVVRDVERRRDEPAAGPDHAGRRDSDAVGIDQINRAVRRNLPRDGALLITRYAVERRTGRVGAG